VLAGLLAAVPPLAAAQEKAAPAQPIPVYESVTSTPKRFEVLKRLWIESGRSPFAIPGYESREEALAAFQAHAAGLGGNGVINFGCYRLPGVFGTGSRLACNGTIVRFL